MHVVVVITISKQNNIIINITEQIFFYTFGEGISSTTFDSTASASGNQADINDRASLNVVVEVAVVVVVVLPLVKPRD